MTTKPVTPKVNFLFKSASETKSLPATMKCLFIFFQVVFALDFGFMQFKSKRTKKLFRIVTFAQATFLLTLLSYLFFYTYANTFSLWYFKDAAIYYIFVIIMFMSENSYYDFQYDLHAFDNEIQVDGYAHRVEYKMFFALLLIGLTRASLLVSYCSFYHAYCIYPVWVTCGYFIVILGFNFVLLAYAFLFQSVYYRMKNFTLYVKNEHTDLVSCHYLYKNLVEITEKAKKNFDLVLVLALVFNTVDVTIIIYVPLATEIMKLVQSHNFLIAYVLVVQEVLTMFAPAITAGRLSSQVESLRLVLYDRLVKEHKNTQTIKRFISYIDARPLRFKVWMVIPLDWTLPVIVVNISVTYLIVMIQFTHT